MAVLSAPDRARARIEFTQALGTDPIAITKPELLAAVEALDGWLDQNSAALNAALPQPARGTLTTRQKAGILVAVIRRRYEVTT